MSRRIVIGGRDCTEDIEALVDQAPPLTPERADQLREIFAPARPIIAERLRVRQAQAAKTARHIRRSRPAVVEPLEAA